MFEVKWTYSCAPFHNCPAKITYLHLLEPCLDPTSALDGLCHACLGLRQLHHDAILSEHRLVQLLHL